MEIGFNKILNEKALYATKSYKKDDIVFKLSGVVYDHPTRETIRVCDNIHVHDDYGIYMNHSFTPTCYIDNYNVKALIDINPKDELTFNYNENEIDMANPFIVDGIIVSGMKF